MAALAHKWRATTEPTAPDPIRRTLGEPERMLSSLEARRATAAHEPSGSRVISLTQSFKTDAEAEHGPSV